MTAYIYALAYPDNNVFYIGKTTNLIRREYQHIWEAKTFRENNPKSEIIRSLLNKGLKPNVIVLREVADEEWKEAECKIIQLYRNMGFELKNSAPGGGAYPSWAGKKHSQETKTKIGKANKGKGGPPGPRGKQKNPQQNPRWDKGLIGRGGRKVYQYSGDGLFLGKFNSTKHAAIQSNVTQSNVVRCCNGVLKQTKGFVFSYEPIQDVRRDTSTCAISCTRSYCGR